MRATVSREFVFDAAHNISIFGADHKCARLHGHTWTVEVSVSGEVNPETGILLDYYDIIAAWSPINEALDHRYLNEVEGLGVPSTENICKWIWTKLEGPLTGPSHKLSRLTIQEGYSDTCIFEGSF